MASLRDAVDLWASIYANSAAVRSAVAFAHVGGLLGAGGFALSADTSVLRALATGADETRRETARVAVVHRIVIASLTAVTISGVLLALADLDAYLESRAFWIKVGLVVALVVNGALLVRTSARVAAGDDRALARIRAVSTASLVLWLTTTLMGVVLPNVL